jgi:hypothetical protein
VKVLKDITIKHKKQNAVLDHTVEVGESGSLEILVGMHT